MVLPLICASVLISPVSQPIATKVFVGYLPDWSYQNLPELTPTLYTDLCYFSVQPTPEGKLDLKDIDLGRLKNTVKLKAKGNFKIVICVGGWERGAAFSKVCGDSSLRSRLVAELKAFVNAHSLDGVDLDWEHPTSDDDVKNYGLLIRDLKLSLGKDKLVTSAMAAWQPVSPLAVQYLDRLNLMAYDNDGRHSTFKDAVDSVTTMVKKGFVKSKIVLGVPFYGRLISDRSKEAPAFELLKQLGANPSKSVDEVNGYYFNNLDTLSQKAEFVMTQGLAGIMVWDVNQDTPDSLLAKTIRKVLSPTPKSLQIAPKPSQKSAKIHSSG